MNNPTLLHTLRLELRDAALWLSRKLSILLEREIICEATVDDYDYWALKCTKDCHITGIAAKACNVLMNPFQSHDLIQKSYILRILIVFAVRQMGQVQETEDAEPVRDCNDDDVRVLFYEIMAVKHRINRAACFKSAAVDPYHNRLLFIRRFIRLLYIQVEAVFIHIIKRPRFQLSVPIGAFRIVKRFIYAVIRNSLHRSLPAQLTDGLPADIGDPSVHDDILRFPADKGPVDALDRQRPVIIRVSDPFVLSAILLPQQCSDVIQRFRLLYGITHFSVLLSKAAF